MRLKKLKLSGFKSFVDPTDIPLPSNLLAIVGPNGCGKSNVIDAVRWVMGESSAKYLRGEMMADVIFNGSATRKPLGQASVEMLFDNSQAKLGGEYAKFNEIAIKRVVTREGASAYYLNGTKCRRKDITNIFLGTGLGSRSYSIIEQGTISRLIEAKPEELRAFLEEAAGISKYKERRRDTENRIRHTRENLERIEDILLELGKQLDRLKRQARAAEKYKELSADQRLYKAQLAALNWHNFNEQLTSYDEELKQQKTQLQQNEAQFTHIETKITEQREQATEAHEAVEHAQTLYYRVAADIARIEEAIQHHKHRKQQLTEDLARVSGELAQANTQQQHDAEETTSLQESIAELTPQQEELQNLYEELREKQQVDQENKAELQQDWDKFQQEAAESNKTAHVEQARMQQFGQAIEHANDRIRKLEDEREAQQTSELQAELSVLTNQETKQIDTCQTAQDDLEAEEQKIKQQRASNQQITDELEQSKKQLHQIAAKQAQLQAIQQAALGKQNSETLDWLTNNQLANNARLGELVSVEKGWEVALETVLGEYLQAVCVDKIASVDQLLAQLPNGKLIFLAGEVETFQQDNPQLLGAKIEKGLPVVKQFLADIYCAEDLIAARNLLNSLPENASVITRDGIWISKNWLRVVRDSDQSQGILQREKTLNQLATEICEFETKIANLEEALTQGKEYANELEQNRDAFQQALLSAKQELSEIVSSMKVAENKLHQKQQRISQIEKELTDQQNLLATTEQQYQQSKQDWQAALNAMDEHSDKEQELIAAREQIEQLISQQNRQISEIAEKKHQTELQLQSAKTRYQSLIQSNERIIQQLQKLSQRQEALQLALQEHENPENDLTEQLQQLLTEHKDKEQALTAAKEHLQEVEQQLATLEKERHDCDVTGRKLTESHQALQMQSQTIRVRCATIEESLQETEFQLKQLIEEMPEEANQSEWEERLQSIEQRISRLGPINLAAIDEYASESERKDYLDAQKNDLVEALNTLEAAMNKIDKETKQRFQDTYNRVNASFSKLFPVLFGGGKAYLELTGDDLLSTGVSVIARPPGKRNTSIHMLSGGEKAMTAVALVFAIFQLNPSPFCMLDEVDAPLDDANVTRFCKMVQSMSDEVQFIFITHNKVTMELAEHLSGVTMKEPGVSRIVSVDVDQAVDLAEA